MIINGKRYDINTATKLATSDNGEIGGLNYVYETLYRKKTGEYFLLREGGARTILAKYSCGSYTDGSKIEPMTYAEATKWAEKKLDADDYESIFGNISTKGKEVITFTVPSSTAAQIRRMSEQQSKPIGEILTDLIKDR